MFVNLFTSSIFQKRIKAAAAELEAARPSSSVMRNGNVVQVEAFPRLLKHGRLELSRALAAVPYRSVTPVDTARGVSFSHNLRENLAPVLSEGLFSAETVFSWHPSLKLHSTTIILTFYHALGESVLAET